MAEARAATRLPGETYAVSDTGPLISAFQSDSFVLFTQIFAEIHISPACLAELTKHGWEEEVRAASPKLVVVKLMPSEQKRALTIAQYIAQHPDRTIVLQSTISEKHKSLCWHVALNIETTCSCSMN